MVNLVSLGLLGCALISWIILLAGVSALQHACTSDGLSGDCSKAFGWASQAARMLRSLPSD